MSIDYPVVVVGAGQAGLSASYYLKQQNIEHVLLERSELAHAWRSERWDSFCLVTPNWQCQLPGYPYQGSDPDGFMPKEDIVGYLESYAKFVAPPLRTGVSVDSVRRLANGNLQIDTSSGSLRTRAVILAVGAYHRPIVPPFATEIPTGILQMHSRDYKNPDQLPRGAVLVVGSGQSGCQIAEDLHFAGREVHLCLGDAPRSPRVYRGRDVVSWLDEMGYYNTPVEAHPDVDSTRDKTNHYLTGRDGGREIDLRLHALRGMRLYGYLSDISGGTCHFAPDLRERLDAADAVYNGIRTLIDNYILQAGIAVPDEPPYVAPWTPEHEPRELDLEAQGITSVVWSIGFRSNFGSFVKLDIFDERGYPRHQRGVSSCPGLYFLGLPWLHTWGSGRMSGVGRDARHVVDHLTRHLRDASQESAQL